MQPYSILPDGLVWDSQFSIFLALRGQVQNSTQSKPWAVEAMHKQVCAEIHVGSPLLEQGMHNFLYGDQSNHPRTLQGPQIRAQRPYPG